MRFPFPPPSTKKRESDSRLWLALLLFPAFLALSQPHHALAQAQVGSIDDVDSDSPEAPSISQSPAPPIQDTPTPKKAQVPAKYNVDHIGNRGIGRGFNLYSQRRERELGESIAAALDRNAKIVKDVDVNDYINRLAQKIVRNSDADVTLPFTVRVIDSGDIPHAYGLPGGFLYVDSALILAADNESELASIMAHEIAHVAARHATRALTRKRINNIVDYFALFAGPVGAGLSNAGGFAGPLSLKKYSRDAEYEADLLGIEYMYAAGYDPQALLDALEKLHTLEQQRHSLYSQIPGYRLVNHIPFHSTLVKGLSSYPQMEERISRLQSEIPIFLPARNDYILDTDEFESVKARLLADQYPVLRRHSNSGDDKGPVLRRTSEPTSQEVRTMRVQTFLPE